MNASGMARPPLGICGVYRTNPSPCQAGVAKAIALARAKVGNSPPTEPVPPVHCRCSRAIREAETRAPASGRIHNGIPAFDPARAAARRHSRHPRGCLSGRRAPAPPRRASACCPQPRRLPPGSPLIGRPDTEAAMKLAPVAPPPIPTTADKLADRPGKLKLPKGFNIERLCRQRAERALDAPGRQGHGLRRQPPAGQGPLPSSTRAASAR